MSVEKKFLSRAVANLFWKERLTLVTAESCTGGILSSTITSISGSSSYFKGGVVAYSNEAKVNVLGVDAELIETHGAVSEEVAVAMAQGVKKLLNSDCALATTGIAGPRGGVPDKPVGTVWVAAVYKDQVLTKKLDGDNGRFENMTNGAVSALQLVLELFQSEENEQQTEN
ncbi:MAG: CinA family protein [Phocaeicola sp.]